MTYKLPALLVCLLFATATDALATKKVNSPYVTKDELEFEWKGTHVHDDEGDLDGAQENKFTIGYGPTDFWFFELGAELNHEGDEDDYDIPALSWENTFQLTDKGEYWLDVGLKATYSHALEDSDADSLQGKLLLAKDTGQFTHLANIILERQIGDHSDDDLQGGLAWSSRYNYEPWLQPGLELYNDFGDLSDSGPYNKQEHQFGPVFYGKIGSVKYEIGYLFGLSNAAPDGEAKWMLEYDIFF